MTDAGVFLSGVQPSVLHCSYSVSCRGVTWSEALSITTVPTATGIIATPMTGQGAEIWDKLT